MKDTYLEGLVAGNQQVIREIYKNFLETSILWIKRNGGSRSDALDIFQEGLTQVLIKARKGSLKIESSFGAYLIGTCKYLWLGRLRKEKQQQKVRTELEMTLTNVAQEEVYDSAEISIHTFLEENRLKLGELCRKLLALVSDNIPPSEIAKKLEMSSANTVYRRKFACMKKWREYIEKDPLFHQWKESQYGN